LRLYNNKIGDEGAKYLADSLKVNKVRDISFLNVDRTDNIVNS